MTISLFSWRTADTTENVDCSREMRFIAKMLVTCFVASCLEMWNVIEKCDFRFFLLQKYLCEFVLVIMLDHLIVYISTVWFEFFRDDECFTRTTHQTRRKRLIKLDTSSISSDLMNSISSNLMNWISSNLTSDSSSNLISDISSNSMRTLFVFLEERFWMTRESM